MIRRVVTVVAVVVLILVSRPIYQLGVGLGFWQPFRHPHGVSREARYVPTLKGSAWFDCSFDRAKDVDVCRAWDDAGHVIAYGSYRIDGEGRAATIKELRPSMVQGYPGRPELSWINLFGDKGNIFGKTLVPVNDAGDPLERFEVH